MQFTCEVFIYGHLDEFDRNELDRYNDIEYTIIYNDNSEETYTNGTPIVLSTDDTYTIRFNDIENAKTPEDIILTLGYEDRFKTKRIIGKYETEGYCYIKAQIPNNYNLLLDTTSHISKPTQCLLYNHLNVIDTTTDLEGNVYLLTTDGLYATSKEEDDLPKQVAFFSSLETPKCFGCRNGTTYVGDISGIFILMEDGKVNYYNIYNDDDLFGIGDYLYSDVMYELPFFYNKGNKAIDISIGSHHVLILLDTGEVCTTGINEFGELGLGDTFYRDDFEIIPNLTNVKKILACNETSLFLLEDGTVYGCGLNNMGIVPPQDEHVLPNWFNNYPITTPTQLTHTSTLDLLPNIKDIYGSGSVFYFIDYDDNIYVSGSFDFGTYPLYKHNAPILGNFLEVSSNINISNIEQDNNCIYTDQQHIMLSDDKTKLYIRGLNNNGVLATGDFLHRQKYFLVDVDWGSPIKDIKVYNFYNENYYGYENCAYILLTEAGDMYFWGSLYNEDYSGEKLFIFDEYLGLGDVDTTIINTPTRITMFDNISPIDKIYGDSFERYDYYARPIFLLENNELYSSGKYPEDIELLATDVKKVLIHDVAYHYILKTDNSLWRKSRVNNDFIKILDNVKDFNHYLYDSIATNCRFSNVALLHTGELYLWEDTFYYYERRGFEDRNISFGTPQKKLDNAEFFLYIGTSIRRDYNYFAQTTNKEIYAWGGKNLDGQLGIGYTSDSVSSPVKIDVVFTSTLVEIEYNDYSTYFIFEDGDVYSMGRNTFGELGIGSLTNTPAATRLDLDEINCKKLVLFASRSQYSALMYTTDNKVYSWGAWLHGYNIYPEQSRIESPLLVINNEEVIHSDYSLFVTNKAIYNDGYKHFEIIDTDIKRVLPSVGNDDRDSFIIECENGDYYYYGDMGLVQHLFPKNMLLTGINPFFQNNYNAIKLDLSSIPEPINKIIYKSNIYSGDMSLILFYITDTKIYTHGAVFERNTSYSSFESTVIDHINYYNYKQLSCFEPTVIFENNSGIKTVHMRYDDIYVVTEDNKLFYRGISKEIFNGGFEFFEIRTDYYEYEYIHNIYLPTKSTLTDFFNIKSPIHNIIHTTTPTYYILDNGDIYANGLIYDIHTTEVEDEEPVA